MTIACAVVVPEGVVLGADSTSTVVLEDETVRHYNHQQKIFEVGKNSSIGIVTWGLGSAHNSSYRTMLADFAETVTATHISEIAHAWASRFWEQYSKDPVVTKLATAAKNAAEDPLSSVETRKRALGKLQELKVGFCIGGCLPPDRAPGAYVLEFEPLSAAPPKATALGVGNPHFWGANRFILSAIGRDVKLIEGVLTSGKWAGTLDDLVGIMSRTSISLDAGHLPIREAADLLHAAILMTIKVIRFARLPPTCGGPIEIATVTTDRPFRWVRHKDLDSAIVEYPEEINDLDQ